MKTITMRNVAVVFSAGILLTSCVSSKKYHRSQDEVARLRNDSSTLAQKGTALQQNLTEAQQKNTNLQKSVQDYTNTNTGLQKNVAYYNDFATKETANTKQLKDELNTTLASSGLTDQDVTLTNGKIYVIIGEKSLFKGNTAVLTPKGKELVNNLGQFVKNHDAVDVSVADLEQVNAVLENGAAAVTGTTATGMEQNGQSAMADNANAGMPAKTNTTTREYTKTQSNLNNKNAAMPSDKTAHKMAIVHHKRKTPAVSGESTAKTYVSGHHANKYTAERMRRSTARTIAWNRQNSVADALLKSGLPKIKLVEHNPSTIDNTGANANAQKGVQIVLVRGMDDFYKHMSEAPATGQPVSINP